MSKLYRSGLLVVALVLLTIGFLAAGLAAVDKPAQAATIVGYQTVTAWDGTEVFTTTEYSSGYLGGAFGEMVIQVSSDISPTGTLTVTPQFSSDGNSCSVAATWADATLSGVFVVGGATTTSVTASTLNTNTITTTVSTSAAASAAGFSLVDVLTTLTGDGDALLRFPTMGKCFRVKLEADTTYTPTVFVWMVNTQ